MASELLKVALKPTCSNSEVKLIDGASGHTYTVLSISICETAGAAETFNLYVDNDDKSVDEDVAFTGGYRFIDSEDPGFDAADLNFQSHEFRIGLTFNLQPDK